MKKWSRLSALDNFFAVFLAIHLPISLLFDAQILLPSSWHPLWARQLLEQYVSKFHDPFLANPPVWFKSFVACELTLQICLLVPGIVGLIGRHNWVRDILLVYGVHVATTTFPLIAELLWANQLTPFDRYSLLAFYLPYLVIPLLMVIRFLPTHRPYLPAKKKRV